MVALNGTHLNGSALPHHRHASPSIERISMDELRSDLAKDQERASATHAESDPPLDPVAAERARIQGEIDSAKARVAAAKERAASRELELRAVIHAEIVASRESIAEMEREHEVAIATVRSTAQAEVERILAEAREQANSAGGVRSQERAVTDAD